MAEAYFDQFSFSVGEVDPRIQSRPDWDGYYKALKKCRNCQVIPQGGVQRRWGTVYVDSCVVGNAAIPAQFEMSTLLYDDTATYVIVWEPQNFKIYLENTLVYNFNTGSGPNTPNYLAEDIANLRFSQVQDRLIITNINFKPAQLVRSADSPNQITATDTFNNYLTITNPLTVGIVYPAQFTTNGTLPTTTPQIYPGRNYFVVAFNTTNVRIYSTADDAVNNVNFYIIGALGASTNNLVTQNTWTLSNINFANVPTYDFLGNYLGVSGGTPVYNFTPGATSGTSVTITINTALATMDSRYVGGLFTGNGGILRITSVTNTTTFVGYTVTAFASTDAIEGPLAYLGQPAWSDSLGWPKYSTFFQNRLVFAGSYSLVNGVWLSTVNEVFNFDDSQALDDDAISWYPAGGGINVIVGMTSSRSLLVHTNNGTFSTPLLNEAPVTPSNFTLTEQNKFAVFPIQPIFIDNQVMFVDTASNIINMIWEITQSAFITNNISVMSSVLIQSPIDTAAFYEPKATDGFYALFVNSDGTLAVYQTLHEQNIGAWSLMNTQTNIVADQLNNYTSAPSNFIHVITGYNRCWFLIQRFIPIAQSPANITAISAIANLFTAPGHGMPIGKASLISFTTSGTLPTTTPSQINTTGWWWARAFTTTTFAVYVSEANAAADINYLTPTALGSNSQVIQWINTPQIYLEELDFDVLTDSAALQSLSPPAIQLTNLDWMNGTVVNLKANGYVLLDGTVFGNSVTPQSNFLNYEVGQNYISTMTPLPVAIPQAMGTLYKPKHYRAMYVSYYNSIGVTIQGYNVPIQTMQQVTLDEPATPQTGVFLATPMEGWSDYDISQSADINIVQANPLPMTILGLSYVLEV